MNHSKIIKGIWYNPDNPKIRLAGEVEFSPKEGIVLSLYGDFGFKYDRIEFLKGDSSEGKAITLYKLLRVDWSPFSSGFSMTKYKASILFLNQHFSEKKELKVKEIISSVTLLNNWLDYKVIEIDPVQTKLSH